MPISHSPFIFCKGHSTFAWNHPAGGVLVLGLDCENNIIEEFIESIGDIDESRMKFLTSQSVSNETIEAGVSLLKEIRARFSRFQGKNDLR